MLRRSVGHFERRICSNRSNLVIAYGRIVLPSNDGCTSTLNHKLHTTSKISSRKAELNQLERRTLAEINLLRQQIEDDAKLESSNESSANLPEITDDTLNLLYEALNTPEPLTEEERGEEERRRRRLVSSSQGEELKERLLQQRLMDIQSRLNEVSLLSESQRGETNDNHFQRLSDILRRTERKSELEEEAEEEGVSVADFSSGPMISISTNSPSVESTLSKIQNTLTILTNNEEVDFSLPLGILTFQDWKVLSQKAANSNDRQSLMQILKLMKDSGQSRMHLKVMNTALEVYARKGEVGACQALMTVMEQNSIELDTFSTHCLIQAYTKEDRLEEAAAVLKHLQDVQPASMQTYHLLIQQYLQKVSQPHLQSKVWTIFKEMRMSAHPIPDAPLYAQMIRACGLGIPQPTDALWKPNLSLLAEVNTVRGKTRELKPGRAQRPDTERALDLFREMTVRYSVRPTPEVYSAVIFACAKRRDMYEKAIEFFQNMLQIERERIATIQSGKIDEDEVSISFAPDRLTYNSILHGCSQRGDLLRARWVLAEMLRSSLALWNSLKARENVSDWQWAEVEARRPDENTLSLIFFTYALYKLPKAPTLKNVAGEGTISSKHSHSNQNTEVIATEDAMTDSNDENAFTERLPESSADIIREANGLIERVSEDMEIKGGLLSAVIPDTRMLNAYLTVLSEHCEESKRLRLIEIALFGSNSQAEKVDYLDPVLNGKSIFERWQLPINGYTCEVVLDACLKSKDRTAADALTGKIWQHWQTLLERNSKGTGMEIREIRSEENMLGIDPIRISRCWAGMIRNLAKSYRIEEAMSSLRSFVDQYPPPSAYSKKLFKNPSATTSTYPFQYPVLTFQQIELLHNRLVLSTSMEPDQRKKDLGFLTWAVKAYEASLKPKKPAVLKPFSPLNQSKSFFRH